MKLTQLAITAINNPKIRIELARTLGCTELTIIRYLKNNDDNLTKAAAMKVIKKLTGLSEKNILTEMKTEVSL